RIDVRAHDARDVRDGRRAADAADAYGERAAGIDRTVTFARRDVERADPQDAAADRRARLVLAAVAHRAAGVVARLRRDARLAVGREADLAELIRAGVVAFDELTAAELVEPTERAAVLVIELVRDAALIGRFGVVDGIDAGDAAAAEQHDSDAGADAESSADRGRDRIGLDVRAPLGRDLHAVGVHGAVEAPRLDGRLTDDDGRGRAERVAVAERHAAAVRTRRERIRRRDAHEVRRLRLAGGDAGVDGAVRERRVRLGADDRHGRHAGDRRAAGSAGRRDRVQLVPRIGFDRERFVDRERGAF